MINFRKHLYKILIVALAYLPPLIAEEQPELFTFLTLESLVQNEALSKEKSVQGQLIQIRGFLYKTNDSTLILAAEPNLKSCCIGSASKRHKQLLVSGKEEFPLNQNTATTLQGNLQITPNDTFPFRLENARIIPEKNQSKTMLTLIGFILILMSSAFFIWKRKKTLKQTQPHG